MSIRDLAAVPLLVLTLGYGSLALCVSGCSEAAPQEPEPIKLGLLSSFTGRDEATSQAEVSAMELAIGEINAAGGLFDGRKVVMVTGNDELKPERGASEARRLIEEEGVAAFVGPISSIVSSAVLEVSVPAKVPNISCCATSDVLNTVAGQSARERYFFRTIPTDSFQAPVLARAAVECHACTKLAVLHRDDIYGNPFAETLAREFSKAGEREVVFSQAYDPDAPSYRTEIEAAAATDADCLAMIAFVRDGSRLRREWDMYAGRSIRWLASEGILGNNFVSMLARPEQADGLVITGPVYEPDTPENESFRITYRSNFDRPPDAWNAQVYDSAALLMLAIARAGTLDGPAIRNALFEVSAPGPDVDGERVVRPGGLGDGLVAIASGRDVNYQGASGSVDFEDFGNVRSDYELYHFNDEQLPDSVGVVQPDQPLPCPPP
jgi:ABC-type branched-subunit amino acid transport system substrate-binding protein